MKKCPKSLSLVLMTSLVMGSAGCSSESADTGPEEFRAFASIEECAQSQDFTREECIDEFAQALLQTPRFNSQSDCEQVFGDGNCGNNPMAQFGGTVTLGENSQQSGEVVAQDSTTHQRSSWMPFMTGYMMARFMSGGSYQQGSQPLFRDSKQTDPQSRSFRTSTGDVVRTDKAGRVANPGTALRQGFQSTAKPAASRGTTSSRSGFGGGSSYGSSSGS